MTTTCSDYARAVNSSPTTPGRGSSPEGLFEQSQRTPGRQGAALDGGRPRAPGFSGSLTERTSQVSSAEISTAMVPALGDQTDQLTGLLEILGVRRLDQHA